MHKVYLKGVRSLEDKFDKDLGWVEENVATIRFDKIPFEEAAKYNKKLVVIMTEAEYEALTSGKNYVVPQQVVEGLKTMAAMTLDLLKECEGGSNEAV
jgi:hypothetical protein